MAADDAPSEDHATSVLIAADVRLLREGLATCLSGHAHLAVAATAASRVDALARVREQRPHVIVVDIGMRESLELIWDAHMEESSIKILAFGVNETTSDVLDCAEAGAAGYVAIDASAHDLVLAIERIAREELVCSPRIAAQLFGRLSQQADHADRRSGSDRRSGPSVLTIREREVLELIRGGHSNKEISQRLNIAEPTVKNHVHHLLEKLDVSTRGQAAASVTLHNDRRRSSS